MNQRREVDIAGLLKRIVAAFLLADVVVVLILARQVMLPRRPSTSGPDPTALGIPYQAADIESNDGTRLAGLYFPNGRGRPTVILSAGPEGKAGSQKRVEFLWRAGYAVLALDLRGQGDSGGDFVTHGGLEQDDVVAAVNFVWRRHDTGQDVALWGIGDGAAAAHIAAVRVPEVRALISESASPSLRHDVERWLAREYGLPPFPLAGEVLWTMGAWLDFAPDEVDVLLAASHFRPRPILVVAAEDDRVVRPVEAKRIYDRSGGFREIWIAPGAGHGEIWSRHGDEYRRRVLRFLRIHLMPDSGAEPPAEPHP